jgi:pimeloyl-ACP methyl ester carboxylesterase
MIKVFLWLLCIGMSGYVLFCALLYLKQRSLLYYPTPRITGADASFTELLNEMQSLGVAVSQPQGRRALIYFGGNAEDVASSLPELQELFPEHAVYALQYRGCGRSTGRATEEALYSDGAALFREVSSKHASVAVMGRSLGTAVAIYLAAGKLLESLILVTPFDSMTELASAYYPLIPVSLLLKDRFESVSRAPAVDVPTLVLIAEEDEVIPRKHSDRLAAALNPSVVTITIIPKTSHNTIETNPLYSQAIKNFIFR